MLCCFGLLLFIFFIVLYCCVVCFLFLVSLYYIVFGFVLLHCEFCAPSMYVSHRKQNGLMLFLFLHFIQCK